MAGWGLALDLASAQGGRLPLRDLLAAAAGAARLGYPISHNEAGTKRREEGALLEAPGFSDAFLVDGRWPNAGERRFAPALADVLDHLGRAGLADFYQGDVARELASDLERMGSPLTRGDFGGMRARFSDPLSVRLAGAEVFNAPPPSQGLASLLLLGAFERLGVARAESFAHIHGLVEASKRAMRACERLGADVERVGEDPRGWLGDSALAREAAALSRDRAAPFPALGDAGKTVWLGAADEIGWVVSYSQSIYWDYGSGCVSPRTGVHFQNRGSAFSLDPQKANALAPGVRPFPTPDPALAVFENGDVLALGGEGQAQVWSRLRLGVEPEEAIDRPRFRIGGAWGEPSGSLKLEPRFDPDLVAQLERAGHLVDVLEDAYSNVCGHAGAVRSGQRGVLAAHDPRADGGAAGF